MVDLFSFDGRINRLAFWPIALTLIAIKVLIFVYVLPIYYLVVVRFSAHQFISIHPLLMRPGSERIIQIVLLIALVPITWGLLATFAKRWHDADMSGWWAPVSVIPFVNMALILLAAYTKTSHDLVTSAWWTSGSRIPFFNIAALLICGLLPGTKGTNGYGPEPGKY